MRRYAAEGLSKHRHKKLMIWKRVESRGVSRGGVGFMQHPREASVLRLTLLNMERGHTAKAAGSF